MASAEVVGRLRTGDESLALASQLRRLTRIATLIALLTSPAAFMWFHNHEGLSVGWSIAATFGTVVGFRGFVDLIVRRLIPWPSLFGTEDARLKEEDVMNRRRSWTWRFFFRLGVYFTGAITIVWLIRVAKNKPNATWLGAARRQPLAVRRGVREGRRQARARPPLPWGARHGQDDARQGDRHRVQLALRLDPRLGLRADLHRHRRADRPLARPQGEEAGAQV